MFKNSQAKHFFTVFIIGAILIAGAGFSQAATYWVSPTGAATWVNCSGTIPLNGTGACSVQTAFNNAVAGDVVNFRGGTYTVPQKNFGTTYHGYYEPTNSGTAQSQITFQAYTGEVPLFDGHSGGTGDVSDFATIFGTWNKSYITFDGFHVQADGGTKIGRIHIGGDSPQNTSTGIILKNSDFNGGSNLILTQDNRETIRIDFAHYVTVSNTRAYHVLSDPSIPKLGRGCLRAYQTDHVTIQNNEFFQCEDAIQPKSGNDTWLIKNNWIHDNYVGIYMTPIYTSQAYNETNITITNNVMANNSYSGLQDYTDSNCTGCFANSDNLIFYNNTIYAPTTASSYGVFISGCRNCQFYNNIIQGAPIHRFEAGYSYFSFSALDYNNYGSGSFGILMHLYQTNQVTYTSMVNWKNSSDPSILNGANPDTHSLASDPLFQNGSGTFTQLNDFILASNSPSKGTGQNGVNMGADISSVGTGVKMPGTPSRLTVR